MRNVNFEKGTLLEYCNVSLVEAMAPSKAYVDAAERRDLLDFDAQPATRDIVIGRQVRRASVMGGVACTSDRQSTQRRNFENALSNSQGNRTQCEPTLLLAWSVYPSLPEVTPPR
ncbi:MAG: hypothetical protein R3C56_18065 [Pirellulaceae bacterium]